MIKPDIDLHIEELVLHGFAVGDRYRIGASVERELARLFAEQGVPESMLHGVELPHLSLASLHVRQGAKPEAIGMQVAQAVYRGLSTAAQPAPIPAANRPAAGSAGQPTQGQSKGGSSK